MINTYTISVPVFVRYLRNLQKLLVKANRHILENGACETELLKSSLQPDMLPFAQQVNVAVAFAQRVCYPLAGQAIPEPSFSAESLQGVQVNLEKVVGELEQLMPERFVAIPDDLSEKNFTFSAGDAVHEMNALDLIQQYGLPNFYFHMSMAYGLLRHQGVMLGKRDFDGLHAFAEGTCFV